MSMQHATIQTQEQEDCPLCPADDRQKIGADYFGESAAVNGVRCCIWCEMAYAGEEVVESPVTCEACGKEYLPSAGYYDDEYSYCSDCCNW